MLTMLADALTHCSRPGFWAALLRCARDLACRVLLCALGDGDGDSGVSTNELIARFQRGQSRAFDLLYQRYKDYVYRVALFVTRNEVDAEEAVQEAFMDVLRALPHYCVDGPARFETWLYRVVVNRCRSRARRKPLPSVEWEDMEERLEAIPSPDPDDNPEGALLHGERALAVWRAVDQLPEGQRVVVLLRYQQELSYSEIARSVGISEGTVKSRLFNAHRKLKDLLQAAEPRPAPAGIGPALSGAGGIG